MDRRGKNDFGLSFDVKGLLHAQIAYEGTKINWEYIIDILTGFLKALNLNRPDLAADNRWFFHLGSMPPSKLLTPLSTSWHQGHQEAQTPTLRPGPGPCRLLLVPQGEKRPGRHVHGLRRRQEGIGGGHQLPRRQKVNGSVHNLDGADWKMYSNRWKLCWKITFYKDLPKMCIFCVISLVRFWLESTS